MSLAQIPFRLTNEPALELVSLIDNSEGDNNELVASLLCSNWLLVNFRIRQQQVMAIVIIRANNEAIVVRNMQTSMCL